MWKTIILLAIILVLILILYLKIKNYKKTKESKLKITLLVFINIILIIFIFKFWDLIWRWFITYDNILYDMKNIFTSINFLITSWIIAIIIFIDNYISKNKYNIILNIVLLLLFVIFQFLIHHWNRVSIWII